MPNQFKPIGSPAANVRNSAGIAPKENNTESRVTTILEELAKTKTRLSHVEEERSQLRAALNDRNQELERLELTLTAHSAQHNALLQEVQRYREKSEQLENDVGPIIEENDRLGAEIAQLRRL